MLAAIIQARVGSTRLPGKVLLEICGKPMLLRVVERVKQAKHVDRVIVACSDRPTNLPLVTLCEDAGVECFSGSENDVLDRYYQIAKRVHAESVLRITADCPLIDREVIDVVTSRYLQADVDYVSNRSYPNGIPVSSYPDGLDAEVFSFSALERAWSEARLASDREHVTPFIWRNPQIFRTLSVGCERDLSHLRWTVDESVDLDFVRVVYRSLGDRVFGMRDILQFLCDHPELSAMNSHIPANEGYLKSIRADGLSPTEEGGLDRLSDPIGKATMSKVNQRTDPALIGAGQQLYQKARKLIPGGTQLLSKRPEMFLPELWPSYFQRVSGADVWDLDGKHYIDMSHNSVGVCTLGAADPDVDNAVRDAISKGVMSTLNCPEEVELAGLLCALHPWAGMVRYARTGGEAMAIAARLVRARTGRDRIAFCGYHGWHDWYLAANIAEQSALDGHHLSGLEPAGVPSGLRGSAIPFHYNQIQELEQIVARYGTELAAVVMEPIRDRHPAPGFLEGIRKLTREIGALLVFDEITAAFRLTTGGAHLKFAVEPDVAVFAKAISNGYPMAAIIGTIDVMQAAQETFISSTYWTDRIGPVAALATIRKHRALNVSNRLISLGERVQAGWKLAAEEAGISVTVGGMPPLSHFDIDCKDSAEATTLFTQIMLERGFLAGKAFYPTFAHADEQIEQYLRATRDAFRVISEGKCSSRLRGPKAHSGFARLT